MEERLKPLQCSKFCRCPQNRNFWWAASKMRRTMLWSMTSRFPRSKPPYWRQLWSSISRTRTRSMNDCSISRYCIKCLFSKYFLLQSESRVIGESEIDKEVETKIVEIELARYKNYSISITSYFNKIENEYRLFYICLLPEEWFISGSLTSSTPGNCRKFPSFSSRKILRQETQNYKLF